MTSTFVIPAESRASSIERLSRFVGVCLPGKRLLVTVGLYRKRRSDQQNRALWGVAYKALREQTGNEPEDLHAYFCGEYWSWKEINVFGQRKRVPLRTTTIDADGRRNPVSTVEFNDFYAFIQQRSAENGFNVPDPNEGAA